VVNKIISGGQTGVDRAALDVAMELGIEAGGWCPAGRWAEDGAIDSRYPLQETEEADTAVRTRRNVEEADATLVLSFDAELSGGTLFTVLCAEKLEKPFRVITINPLSTNTGYRMEEIRQWSQQNDVRVLNVAGPRESEQPGIYAASQQFLRELLHN
jgi:hypothetical protein